MFPSKVFEKFIGAARAFAAVFGGIAAVHVETGGGGSVKIKSKKDLTLSYIGFSSNYLTRVR